MPAPYPKACISCAKSKRRCDMASPRCYRCKVRSLECQYQHTPITRETNTSVSEQTSAISTAFEGRSVSNALRGNGDDAAEGTGLVFEDTLMDMSLPSFPDYNLDWQDIMENIQDFAVPDQLRVNDSPSRSVLAGEIYQARIIYSVKRMKSLPSSFVSEGRTSFIHTSLYEPYTPQAIQDILGLCALYDRKTEANQGLVHRIITQLADRLIVDFAHLSALEQLASVQAMTLLQIIRLFDGDIRLRGDAERTEPLFVEWIRQLQHQTQQLLGTREDMACQISSETTGSWQNWLYAESLRRTIIMGYTLQGLYCFLKNGWDDSHHEFGILSFFAQKALWAASSEPQWKSCLNKHDPLAVRFNTWDEDISAAKPTDIDDLGMTMMVLVKGVDYCSSWAGDDNAEKFGLVS
ncbi:hypothetical protein N7517_003989 [Penicillium concentricum]|uniref:Zn(2)-C6 fungal-type domain-containing protein n=1 Tax=Penicillium concentricum TaxID=293559 RepID=A0A9W9S9C8_9EURO|nr:uncharacterized protein N7517_003989 [Penicillium concentricum]KAJ5371983.1 hypothetical protein N7517_003989 [Penicillium concentricum]